MQHLLVSMTDNENSKFTFVLPIRGIMCTSMYMTTTYSRKLKAENDSGYQEDRFGLCYAQHIDSNKTTAGHLRRNSAAYLTHGGELECKVTGRR